MMGAAVADLLSAALDAGCRIVGGCCGTARAHVAAMAAAARATGR